MTARIWLSAGEPSGDLHAAALAPALARRLPGAVLEGMGGRRMAAAGVRVVHDADHLSARGLAEAVRQLPGHVHALRDVRTRLRAGAWDLVVLVDYPGYHLRVARAARAAGVPVLYYIAPQLWAWGAWRAARLRRAVNRLAVILPFEEPFFRRHQVPAQFVGHPLLDQARPERTAARGRFGLVEGTPVLALLPGGRADDVRRHWPLFRDAARRVREARPDVVVLVAGVASADYPGADGMIVAREAAPAVLAAADAALCKSGTATLEAALADTPLVVAYRHHPLTHAVARHAVRAPAIALVNLVAETRLVPELIQRQATPAALGRAVVPLLDRDGDAARRQRAVLATVRARLGTPGAAERVATMAGELAA